MITADISVNGVRIGSIHMHRLDKLDLTQNNESIYAGEYYEPEKDPIRVIVTQPANGSVISLIEQMARAVSVKLARKK